jgi:hypothetical protein
MSPDSTSQRRLVSFPVRMKGHLSEMVYRMTDLYSLSGTNVGDAAPLLPETLRLLRSLEHLTLDGLDALEAQDTARMVSYRAGAEPNVPFLKFRITEADENLLRFAGRETVDFEVLQVFRAGFQYHWRSDLSRAFEEQVPVLSRMYGLLDIRELVVEHVALPIIRKHRVREIRGWFTFSQELDTCSEWAAHNAISLFRRTEHARPVRLPARLWDPERRRMHPAGLFRAVNRGWREAKGQRHL